ncbi:hypothetical protein [Rhizobium ruizarguesonis]|uniref:hypothetical protein n=1 Tax=Rhizobium ruizarguesonis TaxID=2081791 RepID=UPI00103272BB|nr:hypothetical protein [Rhizobium ruizarguesonis]TBD89784.1 hypothetical protein ELH14_09090 [Rhizobium ruizarguesonis]
MADVKQDKDTRVDLWLRWLKNNPITSVIIVAAISIGAAGSFYKSLPDEWKCVKCLIWPSTKYVGLPNNGWVYVGYLQKGDVKHWAQPSKVDIVTMSDAPDRNYPIRAGDIVRPKMPLPQVIIGFADTKEENVLRPPPELVGVIDPKKDYTGRILDTKTSYLVNDVSVAAFPDHDAVMWLRLTPWAAN